MAGRERVIDTVRTILRGARSVHQAHTPLFEFAGDEVRVTWTTHDRIVWDDVRGESRLGHGHERWVRTGASWTPIWLHPVPVVVDQSESAPLTIYEAVRRATRAIPEFTACRARSVEL